MDLKPLLKEWRIWVLVAALLLSLVALAPHYERTDSGELTIATGINKGLDLKGGIRVLLKVQSNNTTEAQVNQIKNILETRISAFGLTQTDIRTVRLGDAYRIQIEVANTNRTRLERLISQEGSFQARMPLPVSGERYFNLSEPHLFQKTSAGVKVGSTIYMPGETFKLDGTRFIYLNNTEGTAKLEVIAYSGENIEQVLTSDSMVTQSGSGYSFRFPVVITTEAARNVQRVASNYDTVMLNGQPYLGFAGTGEPAKLRLYVDDEMTSSLNVAASFKTSTITQPVITGGGDTADAARKEMRRLQSILQSGKLPAPVKIQSISSISSSLGKEFMSAAVISIIASVIAVGGLVLARYQDIKIAPPIVVTGSSEVFILIGMWFSTVATLDLASIAGIVAAVGTGVDDQIIIADESGREKVRSWSKRMKRAFFVIFTSAASTIGAMTPIVSPELSTLAVGAAGLGLISYTFSRKKRPQYLLIGSIALTVGVMGWAMNPSSFALQSIKGFAITTILGVLVGITITRPAYAKFLEHIGKK